MYGQVKFFKSKWTTYPRVVHRIHPSHILTYTRGFTSAAVDATHLAHCEYPTVSCCCLAFRESSRDEKWYHSSILLLIIVCAAALWRALFPFLTRSIGWCLVISCFFICFFCLQLYFRIYISVSDETLPFLLRQVGGSPAVYAPIERWCSPIIIKLKKNALLRKKKNTKEIGCQLLLGSTAFETMLVILLCSFYRCLRLPIRCGGEAMSLQSPVIWL